MQTIRIKNLLPTCFTDRPALHSDVWLCDFSFEKSHNYLIEAESGSGKTSLCSFIYGMRYDYFGSISFDNTEAKNQSFNQWQQLRTNAISVLFQELRLFNELTAFENVLIKNNQTNFKTHQQINTLFEQLDIAETRHCEVGKLSFGQQQRIAFIRALCQPFDFLLLDEPISHLDDKNAMRMAQVLQDELTENGSGVLVTSIGKPLPLHYFMKLKL